MLGEAGDGERDPIGVFAGSFDVVGRIGRSALLRADSLVEHGEQAIEPDGRTIERRKIIVQHVHILL